MVAPIEQHIATGRRKTATARVYLRPGRGKIVVNGQPFTRYFGERPELEAAAKSPLKDTHTITKYDIVINVCGGGHVGQVGAIRMGVARALVAANPALRSTLKSGGHLTRDARMKERKKPGQPGARKRFQFSKR
jgi:small subunit ribosomal protein S9